MSWLITVLTGIFSGLAGGLGMFAMAQASVGWHRISSFEGKSGYFVAGLTLVGGLGGFILGMIGARLGYALILPVWWVQLVVALAGVSIAVGGITLISYCLADFPPTHDGKPIDIRWEIRLPIAQMEKPVWPDKEMRLQLVSFVGWGPRPVGAKDAQFSCEAFRMEQGQWILPCRVPLYTSKGQFCVNLTMGGRDDGFWPQLCPRPQREYWDWSPWCRTNKSADLSESDATMYRFKLNVSEEKV